ERGLRRRGRGRATRDASWRRRRGLRRLPWNCREVRPRGRAEAVAHRSERQRAGDRLRRRGPRPRRGGCGLRWLLLRGTGLLCNQQETFGPIVPLIRVRSDEEALAVANDSHLGLQAAVYTSSLKRAFRYVDHLRVGNVVVNDSTDYWEAHEPFGGASGTQSGWGRIGGRYTMLDMSDLKTVVLDVGGLE